MPPIASFIPFLLPRFKSPHLPASSWAVIPFRQSHVGRRCRCAVKEELPDHGGEEGSVSLWFLPASGSEWETREISRPCALPVSPPLSVSLNVFCVRRLSICYSALSCLAKSPIYDPTLRRKKSHLTPRDEKNMVLDLSLLTLSRYGGRNWWGGKRYECYCLQGYGTFMHYFTPF